MGWPGIWSETSFAVSFYKNVENYVAILCKFNSLQIQFIFFFFKKLSFLGAIQKPHGHGRWVRGRSYFPKVGWPGNITSLQPWNLPKFWTTYPLRPVNVICEPPFTRNIFFLLASSLFQLNRIRASISRSWLAATSYVFKLKRMKALNIIFEL